MLLSMNKVPKYEYSSFRTFFKGEHHITRICPENVLLIVFSGVLRFEEEGKLIELGVGEYYIQRSGLPQSGIIESDMPYYYYIHFTSAEFSESGELPIQGIANIDEILPLINRLDKACIAKMPEIICNELFLRIITKLYLAGRGVHNIGVAEKTARYIEEHISEKFKISDIAKELGYTDDYIIRMFKKHYNMTPYDHLINLRISAAKQQLLTTSRSVSQIALECGWNDTASFHKAFLAKNGISPAAWRRGKMTEQFSKN